jgi:hypothetical protein
MIIRIRFGRGPRIGVKRHKKRRAALILSVLLTPASAMALALALWGIAADLNWTSSFAISSGLFSHWQSWLGAAALLQLAARKLNRYARNGDAAAS